MYCIIVTGIPASGKSTVAGYLSDNLKLPMISKDSIKELLFDKVGFKCREEKVRLGNASMDIMYYMAEQLMKCGKPFILENNFEDASKEGLFTILEKYSYQAVTVRLTGDYRKIYERFVMREGSPDRHRGHVVNDCYPEPEGIKRENPAPLSFESYLYGIEHRGFDRFAANGPCIMLDTTDFSNIDMEKVLKEIKGCIFQCREHVKKEPCDCRLEREVGK